MNPTLRQMRAFVALAESNNFTLAAQALHVTQSALSGLIKELESTLGTRLVDRSTRRITLTDIGRELYPQFSQMLDDLDGALANIADHTRLKKGVVRVAAPQLMCCTLLPEVIGAYRASHPDIELRVADCAVESVTARVLSGEADFGVGPERTAVPQLQARELLAMPFAAVFPHGHALEKLARVTWRDLGRHPFIALQGQFTERLQDDMQAAWNAPPLKPANEVSFMTTALAMVSAGLGVTACLPYAEPLARLYRLHMRTLVEPELTRRFFIYTRTQRTLAPAAESFIDFLFAYVKGSAAQEPAAGAHAR